MGIQKYTDSELTKSELDRLLFLLKRDGHDSTIEFAKRGMKNYKMVLRKTPSILTRRALVISRLVYRQFLINYNEYFGVK